MIRAGSDLMLIYHCLSLVTDILRIKSLPVRIYFLTNYLIETPFETFANRADPDQGDLVRSGSTLFVYENMIR